MTFATKDEALDALEQARAEYLASARAVARELGKDGAIVTVNCVREHCPPPEGIDPRVMGAIFRPSEWVRIGYGPTKRRASHQRPIAQFRLL